MPRYIDADALHRKMLDRSYDALAHQKHEQDPVQKYVFNREFAAFKEAAIMVREQETANEPQFKHGRWLRAFPTTPKSYVRICSVCKGTAYAIGKEYDYCPNCQAVMDEEVD